VYTSRQLADILFSNYYSNKDLGQNFLIDDSVIESIGKLAELDSKDENRIILEIGLGPGALTQKLLQHGHKVIGIEIDNMICNHISHIFENELNLNQLSLIEGDALKVEWPLDITDVVANIPYQISSPLLEKISKICNDGNGIKNCVFMFQEEFAKRICADNNISNRGPLWITTSLDWQITLGKKISPSSFKPQPKVESRLVKLKRRDLLNSETVLNYLNSKNLKPPSKRLIRAISAASFNQRRKKLRNSLKRQPSKLKLKHGFDPNKWGNILNKSVLSMGEGFFDSRPEQLTLDDWIEFSAQIMKFQKEL
tara:strand:- start:632 stop:1564 length:933 start_codon:yes stop_codon:yes gene_type:complete